MKFILGKKLGMSQIFKDDGTVVPVTVIEAGPVVVIQIKTKQADGYEATQVGFGEKKKITKSLAGHFKNLGPPVGGFRYVREFKNGQFKIGDKIDISIFNPGDKVKISGISKGKGFAGAMKRHGFHGMPASHGHKHVKRHVGSIGQRFPQHTLKGMRMAGRMGGQRVSIRGLEVVGVEKEKNLLIVKGAVPGQKGTLLEIVSV